MKKHKRKEQTEEGPQAMQPANEETDELRRQLDDVRKDKDELFAKLQRVSADFANFEKRVPKQIRDSLAYEKERIIRSLLPVLDNFEHTLNAHSGEIEDPMVRGVQIIYDQMLDILKSHGIEQIKAQGELFDPSQHEAMMRRHEVDKDDDVVLEEFQKGYRLNDRVLRPSRVVVNKVPTPPTQEGPEPEASEQGTDVEEQASEQQNETE